MRGVYSLILEVRGEVEVGALGGHHFDGMYVYVGSALGPGGLKRVDRHVSVKDGGVRRWHVDHILHEGSVVSALATVTGRQLECEVAGSLGERLSVAVEGFGCSDCSCRSHLFGPGDVEAAAVEAHGELWRQPQ